MLTITRTILRELVITAVGLAALVLAVALVVKAKADELPSWKVLVMFNTPVGSMLLASHNGFPSEQECNAFLKSKDYKAMTDNVIKHITDAGGHAKVIAAFCTDKVAPPPPKGEAI